jgi:hypothetical protein
MICPFTNPKHLDRYLIVCLTPPIRKTLRTSYRVLQEVKSKNGATAGTPHQQHHTVLYKQYAKVNDQRLANTHQVVLMFVGFCTTLRETYSTGIYLQSHILIIIINSLNCPLSKKRKFSGKKKACLLRSIQTHSTT